MDVGKVTSAAARYQNLATGLRVVFQQKHAPATLPRDRRAHQPSSPRAQHNHIEFANFSRHPLIVAERTQEHTIARSAGNRDADQSGSAYFDAAKSPESSNCLVRQPNLGHGTVRSGIP